MDNNNTSNKGKNQIFQNKSATNKFYQMSWAKNSRNKDILLNKIISWNHVTLNVAVV
uniref:Uncharacterized protein n=1 Tax=Arion vulgaris TaxID=1028688 RepID=A0A0B7AYN2_9EUPU